jgi:hypothetical protein
MLLPASVTLLSCPLLAADAPAARAFSSLSMCPKIAAPSDSLKTSAGVSGGARGASSPLTAGGCCLVRAR